MKIEYYPNKRTADWTFVCPANYKNIKNKTKRIEVFYKDGHKAIEKALKAIKYNVPIDVPTRYQRNVCHTRASGYPGKINYFLDSCFRRNDKIKMFQKVV